MKQSCLSKYIFPLLLVIGGWYSQELFAQSALRSFFPGDFSLSIGIVQPVKKGLPAGKAYSELEPPMVHPTDTMKANTFSNKVSPGFTMVAGYAPHVHSSNKLINSLQPQGNIKFSHFSENDNSRTIVARLLSLNAEVGWKLPVGSAFELIPLAGSGICFEDMRTMDRNQKTHYREAWYPNLFSGFALKKSKFELRFHRTWLYRDDTNFSWNTLQAGIWL